jgi:hypothetical protein
VFCLTALKSLEKNEGMVEPPDRTKRRVQQRSESYRTAFDTSPGMTRSGQALTCRARLGVSGTYCRH